MKRGHRPRRTCLGCDARDEQRVLIRLVVGPGGQLQRAAHGVGRGGYLHGREECWRRFLRRKSLYRAFHAEVGRQTKEGFVASLKEELFGLGS